MIPKRIFFFWGNETMSWARFMTVYSFRKLHPDWEIVIYTGSSSNITSKPWRAHNEQDFFAWKGKDYSGALKDLDITFKEWRLGDNSIDPDFNEEEEMGPSHKSNFLKWCKLYEEGGVYSDLDILYLHPIDSYYDFLNREGVTTCLCCHNNTVSIGWMASTAGNRFFRDCFKSATETYTSKTYQSAGVHSVYQLCNAKVKGLQGHLPISEIQEQYPDEKVADLPVDYFYRFRPPNIPLIFEDNIPVSDLPPETLGIHWYAGHPIAQKWNKFLNGDNYHSRKNTFTNACISILD